MCWLTFDLDQYCVIIALQALLHSAAVDATIAPSQALQVQGEVGRGVGVVEQGSTAPVGLADLHPVAAGNQDLRLLIVNHNAPFDPREGESCVAAVGEGGRWRVRQGHQAGQGQIAAQHRSYRWADGDGHLEEL